jgi:hypothetical protein
MRPHIAERTIEQVFSNSRLFWLSWRFGFVCFTDRLRGRVILLLASINDGHVGDQTQDQDG